MKASAIAESGFMRRHATTNKNTHEQMDTILDSASSDTMRGRDTNGARSLIRTARAPQLWAQYKKNGRQKKTRSVRINMRIVKCKSRTSLIVSLGKRSQRERHWCLGHSRVRHCHVQKAGRCKMKRCVHYAIPIPQGCFRIKLAMDKVSPLRQLAASVLV